jgi:hypothetical protein
MFLRLFFIWWQFCIETSYLLKIGGRLYKPQFINLTTSLSLSKHCPQITCRFVNTLVTLCFKGGLSSTALSVHSLKLRGFGSLQILQISWMHLHIVIEDSAAWGFNEDIELWEYRHGKKNLLH